MQFDCCLDQFEFVTGSTEIVLPDGVMNWSVILLTCGPAGMSGE
jgi:hypothetical protein